MPHRLWLVLVALLTTITPPALGQAKKVDATGRRYALIVGVGEATVPGFDMNPLPDCLIDAENMDRVLSSNGYLCRTLTDERADRPTLDGVRKALKEMCDAAGESDLVIAYFSSHGGAPNGMPVVALADAFIEVAEVKRELAASRALVRIVFLDCCRVMAGFPTESSELRDIHIVLGCRPDEESQISPRGGSIFTEVLVEALRDCKAERVLDGRVELDEILYYLDAEVPRRAMEDWGVNQNPTRTVVDPRAINPVVAGCGRILAPGSLATVGVNAPVRPGPRNDLILSAGVVGRLRLGMPLREMLDSVGRPAWDIVLDEHGHGFAFYTGMPGPSDETVVAFEQGRVSRVETRKGIACESPFDADRSRARYSALANGLSREDLGRALLGEPPARVFEALGCPWNTLRLDETGAGAANYKEVPVPGGWLDVEFVGGVVSDFKPFSPVIVAEPFDVELARAEFWRLVGDGLPSDRLRGRPLEELLDAFGRPEVSYMSLAGPLQASLTYADVPEDGCRLDIPFSEGRATRVTLERRVPCLAGFDAERTREAFARISAGVADNALTPIFEGMKPEQVQAFIGCPAEATLLDETGFGIARYFDIPEAGDALFVIFRDQRAVEVSVRRRVR